MIKKRVEYWFSIIIALTVIITLIFGLNFKSFGQKVETKTLPSPDRYTVKNGDSLYYIAKDYGLSIGEIKQVNDLNTDQIITGQILIIPKDDSSVSPVSSNSNQYTVKYGDSLFVIAKQYGITMNQLMQFNNLKNTVIFPGQVLRIPSKTSSGYYQYTVKSGDTLSQIAIHSGTTVLAIRQANNLNSDYIESGQVLKIPGVPPVQQPVPAKEDNQDKPLSQILKEKGISLSNPGLRIVADKFDKTLTVYAGDLWLKNYQVEFGDGGLDDKKVGGDHKTPNGTFYISQISVLNPADEYLGTRWMRLSYPNIEDAERGLAEGLIDQPTYNAIVSAINQGITPPQQTALGGGVGIHGGSTPDKGNNWTWGCVGLSNKDVEDLYDFMTVGTQVVIRW